MGYIACIDLGGTNCRIGVFTREGSLEKSWRLNSKPFYDPNNIVTTIVSELNRFEEYRELEAVGIGIPGIVNNNGVVVSSPNFPLWKNEPVRENLSKALNIRVYLENDANLYALGEHNFGVAKDSSDFVLFTLGTGIGGGIFLNNSLYRGTKGMAGEIGHMVLHPTGPQCGCGNKGCLEAYASGIAIKKQFAQLTNLELEPKEIYELAKKGDRAATKVFEKAAYHLGMGIANIVNLLDVPLIVLGGGVSHAFDIMQKQIKKGFKEHTYATHFEKVEIRQSQLLDNGGVFGAFVLTQNS